MGQDKVPKSLYENERSLLKRVENSEIYYRDPIINGYYLLKFILIYYYYVFRWTSWNIKAKISNLFKFNNYNY